MFSCVFRGPGNRRPAPPRRPGKVRRGAAARVWSICERSERERSERAYIFPARAARAEKGDLIQSCKDNFPRRNSPETTKTIEPRKSNDVIIFMKTHAPPNTPPTYLLRHFPARAGNENSPHSLPPEPYFYYFRKMYLLYFINCLRFYKTKKTYDLLMKCHEFPC